MVARVICLALLGLLGLPAQAAIMYTDRALFESQLGTMKIDGYDNPPYAEDFYINAEMSVVFGETIYQSTFIPETNRVTGNGSDRHYCSGCNGSFLLDFTSTTVGTSAGVYGVGLDVFGNELIPVNNAFVTFGDNSTMNFELPGAGTGQFPFWGLTSSLLIASIHFGAGLDGSPTNNRFALDNLTIGSMAEISAIPLPAAIWLFGSALAGLAGFRLRNGASAGR